MLADIPTPWRRTRRRAALVLALLATAACSGADRRADAEPTDIVRVADDFGDTLTLSAPATRVVSLNPVTTELLFALDQGAKVVGRTSWDLFPEAARAVTDVGDGMSPNVEAVLAQRPDLVILYASETNRTAARQLRQAGVATLSYRTDKIADLPRVIAPIAAAMGASATGTLVADSVRASLDAVRAAPRPARAPRAYWYIWDPPLLTIGGGSYLSELLAIAGAQNVFEDQTAPSPQVSLEAIAQRDPDVILAGPRTAERIRSTASWRSVRAVREGRIVVIDTTIVGRPGVRMGEAARFLRRVLIDSVAP